MDQAGTSRSAAGGDSSPPLVSVVIPAYNVGAFVQQAVVSVLTQTYRRLECIVVDDGSTDDTAAQVLAISDPRLRLVQQGNHGVSFTRNLGVQHARGELVAFLDGDDVWLPTKLARQVEVLQRQSEVGAVLSGYLVTNARLRPRRRVSCGDPHRRLMQWLTLDGEGPSLPSTLLVRRSVLEQVGGYEQGLAPSEDLHFGIRLMRAAPVAAVPEPLSLYRRHAAQSSRGLARFEEHMLSIYDDLLPAPAQASVRRRAIANLYTRLTYHHARARRPAQALRSLRLAARAEPARLIRLPLTVAVRRLRSALLAVPTRRLALADNLTQQPRADRHVLPARHEA